VDSAWHLAVCFPWFQFSRLSDENNRITTMATAAKKWPPITAHELQFWEHTRRINGDQCPKQADIFFLQWGGLSPLERSNGKVMTAMNLTLSLERFKGNRPPHCKTKISAWSGHRSPSIRQVCAWHWSSCAAMGGHFWRRRPWWWRVSLTVGHGAYITTNPTSRKSRNLLMAMNLALSSDGRTLSPLMGLNFWGLNAA
jgi:hypothetical protein